MAAVAIGFAVANLFIGDEVEYYDRAAEHGDHTAFVQDLRTDLSPGYVGQDANLDPDIARQPPPMAVGYGSEGMYFPTYTGAPLVSEVDPADVKFFANAPPEPTIDPADRKFFANAPVPPEPTIDPADRKFFGG